MDKIQKYHVKYYNENALNWSAHKTNSFWHEKPFRKFVKYFKKGNTVLDIGSAYGIHVPLFLGIGRYLKYEGLDISQAMLRIAKSHYPQLKFKRANILDAKTLPKRKYNGFLAAAILMHIPEKNWQKMLKNIEKLIKPGGVGYITLPQERPNQENKKDKRYFTYWNPKKLKKFLKLYGWKILAHGNLQSSTAGWMWYIIKLPNK